ncbi:MAG: MCE family protein [Nitrospinae bacterium]|nr:MCE family protein [Nitrospinota bacterium]
MHYVHSLSEKQKKLVIGVFIAVPLVAFALMSALWAHKRGVFNKVVHLKTNVKTALGVDPQSKVTLSGIEIGKVENFSLMAADSIQINFIIHKEYAHFVKKDSLATLAAQSIIGTKEIRLGGGSASSPLVEDGDVLKSMEQVDTENLINKITPVLNAVESIVLKIEKVVSAIPEESLKSSVNDVAGILNDIKTGKATVGKVISTDKGALFEKVDALLLKLNNISQKIDEATVRLPETMGHVADVSKTMAKELPATMAKVKTISGDLPETQKLIQGVLKNLNKVLDDIAQMTPVIKKSVEEAGGAVHNASTAAGKIPALMDDVEHTLNETLLMIQSLKTAWPVKNFVPAEKDRPVFEPTLREGAK